MTDKVRAEVLGHLGVLTLTRPKALNALDLDMARALTEALRRWRDDERVHAVWLEGEGPKAFCAGGDVRAIVERYRDDPTDTHATAYFVAEYTLDHLLHTYPKPVITVGHGFVMGGGLGMLLGGSVRIVTDSTRVSMPEVRIGLFPDVGASWFLSRAGAAGLWLALTASRVSGADAIELGLADVHVSERHLPVLRESLTQADLSSPERVVGMVAPFVSPSGHRFVAARRSRLAQRLVGRPQEVVEAALGFARDADPWLADGAATLAQGSPTSARLVVEQFSRATHMGLADVFRQDLDMAVQCVRRHDFHEGVRAVLIDKDQHPRWDPAVLDDVTDRHVAGHFVTPFVDGHPLADLGDPPATRTRSRA